MGILFFIVFRCARTGPDAFQHNGRSDARHENENHYWTLGCGIVILSERYVNAIAYNLEEKPMKRNRRFTTIDAAPYNLTPAFFLLCLCFTTLPAFASGGHETRGLSLKLALAAAVEAESVCADQGFRVSVAVVDRGGLVKAHIRGDGSGPHTLESARKKAYTSASLGRPTSALVTVVVNNPSTEGLRDMNDNILILGGGLPIAAGNNIIGGIGVGGAPGGDLDEACAQAGIDRMLHRYDD